MATIRKRKGKSGTHYQAIVRKSAYPEQRRTFATKQEATEWASDLERDIRDRKVDPHRLSQRKTLSDAVNTYLPRIADVRRQRIWDQSTRFLRDTFLPVTSPV